MENQQIESQELSKEQLLQEVRQMRPSIGSADEETVFQYACKLYTLLVDFEMKDKDLAAECFKYVKQMSDDGNPSAHLLLSGLYHNGIGCDTSHREALRLSKQYIEEQGDSADKDVLSGAYSIVGECLLRGWGTQKNVPEAYGYFQKANALNGEYADVIKDIEEEYPMTALGEIDISKRKFSRITKLLLILGIIFGGFVLFMMLKNHEGYSVFLSVYAPLSLVACIGTLFWQKWAAWLLFLVGPFGWLTLLSMLKRRTGYAQPLCSLFGVRDDGRNMLTRMKDAAMKYGDGPAYHADSPETKTFKVGISLAVILIGLLAVWLGIRYIFSDRDWSLAEWNIFDSPGMWFALSVIGFFAQFGDWIHTSFHWVYKWKDPDTGKEKVERSWDIMDEMEGGFIYPVLMHVIFIPAAYGAMFYYIIQCVLALIGVATPFLAAALCLGFVWVFFRLADRLIHRRHRKVLLLVWTLVSMLLIWMCSMPVGGLGFDLDFSLPSWSSKGTSVGKTVQQLKDPNWTRFARVTAPKLNVRRGPDSSTQRLIVTADNRYDWYTGANTDDLTNSILAYRNEVFPVLGEADGWIRVYISDPRIGATEAYISKKYTEAVEPIDMAYTYRGARDEESQAFIFFRSDGVALTGGISNGSYIIYPEQQPIVATDIPADISDADLLGLYEASIPETLTYETVIIFFPNADNPDLTTECSYHVPLP
jgi:hypothetical protein